MRWVLILKGSVSFSYGIKLKLYRTVLYVKLSKGVRLMLADAEEVRVACHPPNTGTG
jgi:hypothetical protein